MHKGVDALLQHLVRVTSRSWFSRALWPSAHRPSRSLGERLPANSMADLGAAGVPRSGGRHDVARALRSWTEGPASRQFFGLSLLVTTKLPIWRPMSAPLPP